MKVINYYLEYFKKAELVSSGDKLKNILYTDNIQREIKSLWNHNYQLYRKSNKVFFLCNNKKISFDHRLNLWALK